MCFIYSGCFLLCSRFFFFKQKTAYEMRISDWSSDVCSSDLPAQRRFDARQPEGAVDRIERGIGAQRRKLGLETLRRRAAAHPIFEQGMDAGAAPARIGRGAERLERRQAEHTVRIIGIGSAREPDDRGEAEPARGASGRKAGGGRVSEEGGRDGGAGT